jgi:hypothetical protein
MKNAGQPCHRGLEHITFTQDEPGRTFPVGLRARF